MELLVPIYELRKYDESDPRWSPLYFTESVTGTADNPRSGNPQSPPVEKAWIITGCFMSLAPQAAVTAGNSEVRINTPVVPKQRLATLLAGKWPLSQLAAGEVVSFSQQTKAVIIGGVQEINAIWQVSAGNAASVYTWSFHGFEVPRANVSLR